MCRLLRLIAIIFSSMAMINATAQHLHESDIPTPVKSKFSSMHPGAKNVRWEKENGNYEAEFKAAQVETSVLFKPDGTFLQTEIGIPVSELPKGVNDYASKNLPGKKISEAAKITDAKGTIKYEAEIAGEDYLFDANGNFLTKVKETDDKEDEDDAKATK